MKANPVKIEIMDTTLRDGEQTSGVSFVPHEKLMIARALLQDLNVDRIEVASARVSEGEVDAVRSICQWARQTGRLHRVEVLGFVDGHASLDWIHACGCKNINLLCKGSENHCTNQLKKNVGAARGRHPSFFGLCRRTGHCRKRLSGRLEQWHEAFAGLCLCIDGCFERYENPAFSCCRIRWAS